MIIDQLYAWVTVASFVTFVSILFWAIRSARNAEFDRASRLPFEETKTLAKQEQERIHE